MTGGVGKNFNILYLNAQGLPESVSHLEIDLDNLAVDVICLSETWLAVEQASRVTIPGYTLASSYCRSKSIRGGVGVWLRDRITAVSLDYSYCVELDFEVCGVKFEVGETKYLFLCLYRSPNGDFNVFADRLERTLEKVRSLDREIYVCGDFNVNFLEESSQRKTLVELFISFNLIGIVHEPTRLNNQLDNIFTGVQNSSQLVEVFDVPYSDHRAVLLKTERYFEGCRREYSYRLVTQDNKLIFRKYLSCEPWSEVIEGLDIQGGVEYFLNTLGLYYDLSFPMKTKKCSGTKKSWVDETVKQRSQKIKDLYILQRRFPELRKLYLESKRSHRRLLNETKGRYYSEKIDRANNRSREMWRVINELSGKAGGKNAKNIQLVVDNKVLQDPSEVAEAFAHFYQQSATSVLKNIPREGYLFPPNMIISGCFFVEPLTEHETFNILCNLKPKRSVDAHGFSGAFLREFRNEIAGPLTLLINKSFAQGVFPECLKLTKVKPLYKKADRTDANNYRPVSLVSTVSKVFEYAMLSRLNSFLQKFHVLSSSQHGFLKSKSTSTAIENFYSDVLLEMEKKNTVVGVYCDLSKAFDTVSHSLLLEKLENYGIRGIPNDWFRSFLEGRKQYVELRGLDVSTVPIRSSEFTVPCGVPQGSVLGPILFLLFVNDLPAFIDEGRLTMYADDTSILISDPEPEGAVLRTNRELQRMSKWFSGNKLYLNSEKTNYTVFHTRQSKVEDMQISMAGTALSRTGQTKFLGLILEETLAWGAHCSFLSGKLNGCIYQIRTLRPLLALPVLLNVYYSEFESRISYGLLFWGSSCVTDLFLLQKKALRCMLGLSRLDSCRPYFKSLKILTLTSLYVLAAACYIHGIRDSVPTHRDVHRHDTRNCNRMVVPQHRLQLSANGPLCMGIRVYNNLPSQIKHLPQKKFRSRLRSILVDLPFYDLKEFFVHKF